MIHTKDVYYKKEKSYKLRFSFNFIGSLKIEY